MFWILNYGFTLFALRFYFIDLYYTLYAKRYTSVLFYNCNKAANNFAAVFTYFN